MHIRHLNVVIIKPSKYDIQGFVERFRLGFMPNATLLYMYSLLPEVFRGVSIRCMIVDEYVQRDLRYLDLLDAGVHGPTLVLIVGTQSHQLHRALDLALLAYMRGCMVVIGGPHVITCDTSMLQGHRVSFALSEAEV